MAATSIGIDEPASGTTTADKQTTIRGHGVPNGTIRYNKPTGLDPEIPIDATGHWTYQPELEVGTNKLTFHRNDHDDDKVELTIDYEPASGLTIDEPGNNSTSDSDVVTVRGTTAPGGVVRFYIEVSADPRIVADAKGHWEYAAHLNAGRNELQFHIEDYDERNATVAVTYVPPVIPATEAPPPLPPPDEPPPAPFVPPAPAPPPSDAAPTYPCEAGDCNCPDFPSHAEAQRVYEKHGGNNWSKLDGNHDGVACETLP